MFYIIFFQGATGRAKGDKKSKKKINRKHQ